MLLSHSGSYYEEYKRSAKGGALARSKLEGERLLTDRAAYISFLEVQLERVSAACLTAQGFSDRIEQVQQSVLTVEDRVANIARVAKLTQTFAEDSTTSASRGADELRIKLQVVSDASTQCAADLSSLRGSVELLRGADSRREQAIADARLELRQTAANLEQRVAEAEQRFEAAAAVTRATAEEEETAASPVVMDLLERMRSDWAAKFARLEAAAHEREREQRRAFDEWTRSAEARLIGDGGAATQRVARLAEDGNAAMRGELASLREEVRVRIGDAESSCSRVADDVATRTAESTRAALNDVRAEVRERVEVRLQDHARTLEERSVADFAEQRATLQSSAQRTSDRIAALEAALAEARQDLSRERKEEAAAFDPSDTAAIKAEVMETVRGALAEHSASVHNVVSGKVNDFLHTYRDTQSELEARLRRGRKHQRKLENLLAEASNGLEGVVEEIASEDMRHSPALKATAANARAAGAAAAAAADAATAAADAAAASLANDGYEEAKGDGGRGSSKRRGRGKESTPLGAALTELRGLVQEMESAKAQHSRRGVERRSRRLVATSSSGGGRRRLASGKRKAKGLVVVKRRRRRAGGNGGDFRRARRSPTPTDASALLLASTRSAPPVYALGTEAVARGTRRDGGGKRGRRHSGSTKATVGFRCRSHSLSPLGRAARGERTSRFGRPPWNASSPPVVPTAGSRSFSVYRPRGSSARWRSVRVKRGRPASRLARNSQRKRLEKLYRDVAALESAVVEAER